MGRQKDTDSANAGMEIDTAADDAAGKYEKKPRDIIVKFTLARLQFLKGRKVLREKRATIFIKEDFNAARMTLAFQCRNLKRDKISMVS